MAVAFKTLTEERDAELCEVLFPPLRGRKDEGKLGGVMMGNEDLIRF